LPALTLDGLIDGTIAAFVTIAMPVPVVTATWPTAAAASVVMHGDE
jgi:hypothetical protein